MFPHHAVFLLCTGCTGKRKRTEFTPLAAYGDRELISDYRFLEEAAGLRDSSARDTQRMVQSQKLQQMRQLQTSVAPSSFVCAQLLLCSSSRKADRDGGCYFTVCSCWCSRFLCETDPGSGLFTGLCAVIGIV